MMIFCGIWIASFLFLAYWGLSYQLNPQALDVKMRELIHQQFN